MLYIAERDLTLPILFWMILWRAWQNLLFFFLSFFLLILTKQRDKGKKPIPQTLSNVPVNTELLKEITFQKIAPASVFLVWVPGEGSPIVWIHNVPSLSPSRSITIFLLVGDYHWQRLQRNLGPYLPTLVPPRKPQEDCPLLTTCWHALMKLQVTQLLPRRWELDWVG